MSNRIPLRVLLSDLWKGAAFLWSYALSKDEAWPIHFRSAVILWAIFLVGLNLYTGAWEDMSPVLIAFMPIALIGGAVWNVVFLYLFILALSRGYEDVTQLRAEIAAGNGILRYLLLIVSGAMSLGVIFLISALQR